MPLDSEPAPAGFLPQEETCSLSLSNRLRSPPTDRREAGGMWSAVGEGGEREAASSAPETPHNAVAEGVQRCFSARRDSPHSRPGSFPIRCV